MSEHLQELYDRSSQNLNEDQKLKLRQLLTKHQAVFSKNDRDIGNTDLVTHKIDVGNT